MEILKKEEFLLRRKEMLEEMEKGKVFIYPTDTIYGIGCNALLGDSVRKIREIKKRDDKPLSIIAPSLEWIRKNCFIDSNTEKWLEKLPGAYTLILELRNWEMVTKEVNLGRDSLGVRIPNNWFASIIEELGRGFVTTSVNISGEKLISKIEEMSKEILSKVDYVIDGGVLDGEPSVIIKLIGSKEEIIKR